jgi:hypothetical protein
MGDLFRGRDRRSYLSSYPVGRVQEVVCPGGPISRFEEMDSQRSAAAFVNKVLG